MAGVLQLQRQNEQILSLLTGRDDEPAAPSARQAGESAMHGGV
jgi:hypothetical protein